MGFGQAVSTCFRKYATFSGRAPRSEFWWFIVFYWILVVVTSIIDRLLGFKVYTGTLTINGVDYSTYTQTGWVTSIAVLLMILPILAVSVRRLHDTDRTGWWWWIGIVCCIGWIVLLIFYLQEGTRGPNKYGQPYGQVF
ncbi:MAG: DUF805 domain-containing protein [Candidatus Nanopelagicales bacterium]